MKTHWRWNTYYSPPPTRTSTVKSFKSTKSVRSYWSWSYWFISLLILGLFSGISSCDGQYNDHTNIGHNSSSYSTVAVDNNNEITPPDFEVKMFKRNHTTGFLQGFVDIDLHLVQEDVSYLENETENTNGVKDSMSEAVSVLANRGERYDIICEASYLTEFVINFPISGKDKFSRTRIVHDAFDNNTFIYRSVFYFFTKEGTTGSIICQSTVNSSLFSKIHIFTQAGKFFVGSNSFSGKMREPEYKTTVQNVGTTERKNIAVIIPCPSNYPLLRPQLRSIHTDDDGNETFPVIAAKYDPAVGFSLVTDNSTAVREYKCVSPNHDEVFVVVTNQLSDHSAHIGLDPGDLDIIAHGVNSTTYRPHVFFPSDNGKIFCIDEDNVLQSRKRISAIHCDSQPDCDLHRNCYEDTDSCTAVSLKGEACLVGNCAVIDESHSNGAVTCQSGSKKRVDYYFTGFDKRRYKTSEGSISKRALIHMDKVNQVLYTDQPTFFFCEAISFIFTKEIQFAAIMENGSRVALVEGETYRTAPLETMEAKLSRGTVQKGILMNVTEGMREIVCMVPWYNSSDWFNISTKFLVKNPLPAYINKTYRNKKFYVGEYERTLTCSAVGEPIPTFQWFSRDGEISGMRHLSFSISDTSDGKSTLIFPVITENLTGEYICLASNRLGSDNVTLRVLATETGVTSGAIVGVSVGTVAVLGIICLGFFMIWKKYLITKMKLRKLTRLELDEFENGNPDALSLGGDLHQHAMYLPFNKQYEIKHPDLVIDKKGILGKGTYGVVLRGRYLGDPVAVKTTMPSADVMYFKALMAEVKIMAFIGQHKNVVKFVGAVTCSIRERSLYVVVELSPFGNLESYLKDHRSTFINFIEGNDIVKPEYTYINVLKRVSSLDLINWCGHIAAGMEYLASKKVIHGDLATRNVLLFPGDVAKITDFGLSRQLYEHTTYVKKQEAPLPWRWMAIESLRDFEFSTESDVWAYGVTAWEIFTLAECPYPGYSFNMDLVDKLEQGLRMNKPKYASDEIFECLINCWNPKPKDRPSFEKLREYFTAIWYKYSDSARAAFGTGRNGICLFSMEPE